MRRVFLRSQKAFSVIKFCFLIIELEIFSMNNFKNFFKLDLYLAHNEMLIRVHELYMNYICSQGLGTTKSVTYLIG